MGGPETVPSSPEGPPARGFRCGCVRWLRCSCERVRERGPGVLRGRRAGRRSVTGLGPRMAGWLAALVVLLWWAAAAAAAQPCPSCTVLRDQLRNISIRSIKEQILSRLGLAGPPNITGRAVPRVPPIDHIRDRSVQGDQPFGPSPYEERDAVAAPEEIMAFAQPHPKLRHIRGEEVLYFKFSDKVQRSRVVSAYLWLYLRPARPDDTAPITIVVSKVLRLTNKSGYPGNLSRIASAKETRSFNSGRWLKLDVGEVVSEWFKMPRQNHGLVVEASGGYDSRSPVVTSPTHPENSQIPFLQVYTEDPKKHRTKRMTGLTCQENDKETRCCKYPLTVDFEEFGWDFIIAPKKYDAYYCSGECPYVFLPTYPHTHIVKVASPEGTTGPCCAPRQMSSISMLFFDNDYNIIFSSLPGMVVDHCGCT